MSRTWRCAGIPPVPAPTLALDFIANPAVPPGFALSRASSATWTGTDGVIYTAGPNVARFDADPATLAPGGLLLEPARTNQHASSLYSGKGGATNGTVTRTDGIDAPDGAMAASRFVTGNTTSGVYDVNNTTANASYCASTFARHVLDSGTGHSVEIGTDTSSVGYARFDTETYVVLSKGTLVTGTGSELLANDWSRYWCVYNAGTKTSMTDVTYGITNYEFDAWGAQFEQGSYPSSYIGTGGAAATCAADVLTTADLSWLSATQGTIVIDTLIMSVGDGGAFAFSLDDGTHNGIGIYKTLGSGAINAYSGIGTGTALGFTATDGQRIRAAIAWSAAGASASASINGMSARPIADAQAVNPKAFSIGSARSGEFNAHLRVRSVTYWPTRFSDADLAALTAISPAQGGGS